MTGPRQSPILEEYTCLVDLPENTVRKKKTFTVNGVWGNFQLWQNLRFSTIGAANSVS